MQTVRHDENSFQSLVKATQQSPHGTLHSTHVPLHRDKIRLSEGVHFLKEIHLRFGNAPEYPVSYGYALAFDCPVNRIFALLIIILRREKEGDERIVFQAHIGAELAGILDFFEAAFDIIQNDGDINITVGGELVTCGRAVKIDAAKPLSV